jgi:hypothetical protein
MVRSHIIYGVSVGFIFKYQCFYSKNRSDDYVFIILVPDSSVDFYLN